MKANDLRRQPVTGPEPMSLPINHLSYVQQEIYCRNELPSTLHKFIFMRHPENLEKIMPTGFSTIITKKLCKLAECADHVISTNLV